ncbi:uncharacterized protein LOC110051324 [Orbicella faveolata]|uniref:uncharacterized protein LOC110051324 n=1 Tax=Orbicella faveolata TaxID=48498 RepID=UPI0009E5012F|nr:uncharacterized protein LOC110051324 [Orbicella faveolata]
MQFNCGRVLEACIVLLEGRVYKSEHPAAIASSATARLISEVRKHVSAQSDRLGFSAQYQMTSPFLITTLILRTLLATTKVPVNSTMRPSVAPTNKTQTALSNVKKPWLNEPASTWVEIRLVTRKGIHLIMFPNGTVAGTWNSSLTMLYGLFLIQSHGRGTVRLKSLTTMKYIAISNDGQIYSTANSSNEDTLLKHAQEENHFYSFSSYLYPTDQAHVSSKWLLAIGSKGQMRNASRVQLHHKSHQFQIIEIRNKREKIDLSALLRPKGK